ncbi:HEPN domain-containing protein [Mucilaginibacter sp.]
MPYTDRFIATDDLLTHLTIVIPTIHNPALVSNYAGFLSVSAVTVYELAIKDIFIDFSLKKHNAFGVFTESHFSRINGRIKLDDLKKEHVKAFGDKYLQKFIKEVNNRDTTILAAGGESIKASYSNLITCRHQYVHQGSPTLSFQEIQRFFQHGKIVIECLFNSMKR